MAKTVKKIVIDHDTARLIAFLSTIVTGQLMAHLMNRGIMTRENVEEVLTMVRAGGMDEDPSLTRMAGMLADALAGWLDGPGEVEH